MGILTRQDRRHLMQTLQDFNTRGKAQMQILIVDTLSGTPIEEASLKAFEAWGLGSRQRDNGVLFLVAVKDRKMRLEVGRGLEGAIPDVRAKRILSDTVVPLFRSQRYSAGISQATYEVLLDADREFADSLEPPGTSLGREDLLVFGLMFLFVVFSVIGRFSGFGSRYHRRTYGGWGGGGWGGGGWGGGGGGWSGGGGSSAGGGASSNW